MALSWFDVVRLTLGLLLIGFIAGIPAGHWLALLPVPDQRDPEPVDAPIEEIVVGKLTSGVIGAELVIGGRLVDDDATQPLPVVTRTAGR